MRKCENCTRELASDDEVVCDDPSCPLKAPAEDKTVVDGELSRDAVVAQAKALNKKLAKPPPLPPPPSARKKAATPPEPGPELAEDRTGGVSIDLARALADDVEREKFRLSIEAAVPSFLEDAPPPDDRTRPDVAALVKRAGKTVPEKTVPERTVPEKTVPEKTTPELPSLGSLREKLLALKRKKDPKPEPQEAPEPESEEPMPLVEVSLEPVESESEEVALGPESELVEVAVEPLEPLEPEEIDEAAIEPIESGEVDRDQKDPTALETDFDVADVPIPDRLETEEEQPYDPTVEASRPSLEEIRLAVKDAARRMTMEQALEEDDGDRRQSPAHAPMVSLLDEDDLPDIQSVDMSGEVLVRQDPLFGQSPYSVISLPEPPPAQPVPLAIDVLLREEPEGIARFVDPDAFRDVVVLLFALGGCAAVVYLVVTNWWPALWMAAGTFLVVVPACGLLGTMIFAGKGRNSTIRVAFRSAGMCGPFALLATLSWLSPEVRAWTFERSYQAENFVFLQTAMGDDADEVSGRACRVLVQDQRYHNWIIAAVDARPSVGAYCMRDPVASEHRIAANRLAELWKSRLEAEDASAATCQYAEHYDALPISEDRKLLSYYGCAFGGSSEDLRRCCGDILKQLYGQGADLVPPMQLVTLEHPTVETLTSVLVPTLRRGGLDATAQRNVGILELDNPEVLQVAYDLACYLLEEPETSLKTTAHLGALAEESCANQTPAENSYDDWQRICEIVVGPRLPAVAPRDHFCVAVDSLNIAKAMDEALVRVAAALARHKSHQIESGIEVGVVKERMEREESWSERNYLDAIESIEARYDANSKRASFDALADREARMAELDAAEARIRARENSAAYRDAHERRENIMRVLKKYDPEFKEAMRRKKKSRR